MLRAYYLAPKVILRCQISHKEAFMTLRRILIGLALCLTTLTMFLGCAEPGPSLPPPSAGPPPSAPPPPPTYFVTVSGLALREGPTTAAPQISTLQFNDQVQLLETSDGWGKVVDMRRNITGWASMRYLQSYPASGARSVPRRSTPAPKPAPRAPEPKAM